MLVQLNSATTASPSNPLSLVASRVLEILGNTTKSLTDLCKKSVS